MSSFTAPASPEAPKPSPDSPKDKSLLIRVFEGVQGLLKAGGEKAEKVQEFLKKATLEHIKELHKKDVEELQKLKGEAEGGGNAEKLYAKAKELIDRRIVMHKGATLIEGAQQALLKQIEEIQAIVGPAADLYDSQNVKQADVKEFDDEVLSQARSAAAGAKEKVAGKEKDPAAVREFNSAIEKQITYVLTQIEGLDASPTAVVSRGKALEQITVLRNSLLKVPVKAEKPSETKPEDKEKKDKETIQNKMNRLMEALNAATKELQEKKELTSGVIRDVVAKVKAATKAGEPNPSDDQIKGAFTSELPPDSVMTYAGSGKVEVKGEELTLEDHEKKAVSVFKDEKSTEAQKTEAGRKLQEEYQTALDVGIGEQFLEALRKEFGEGFKVSTEGGVLKIERAPARGAEADQQRPAESGEMPKTMEEWMKKILEIIQQIFNMLKGIEGKIDGRNVVPLTKEDEMIRKYEGEIAAEEKAMDELKKKDPKHPDIRKHQQNIARLRKVVADLKRQKQEAPPRKEKIMEEVQKAGGEAEFDSLGRLILYIEKSDDGTYRRISAWLQGRMTPQAAQRFGNRLEHGQDGRIQFPLSPDETIYALGLQPVVINNYNYGNQQIGGQGNIINALGRRGPRPGPAPAPSRPESIPAPAPLKPEKPEVKPAPAKPEVKPEGPSELTFIKNRYRMIRGMLDEHAEKVKNGDKVALAELRRDAQDAIANRRNQLQDLVAKGADASKDENVKELRDQITALQNDYLYEFRDL